MRTTITTTIGAALLASAASVAQAGKLADGFRGLQFGPSTVLDQQPLPECAAQPEPGVRWQCHTTIATVPVRVSYMQDEQLFHSVLIQADGAQNLAQLQAALTAAWGAGQDGGHRFDRLWVDGSRVASLSHNSYSYSIIVLVQDRAVVRQVEQSKARRAADAVNDL